MAKTTMSVRRKYTTTFGDAKKLYKLKTGVEWANKHETLNPITIFKLKIMRTATRRYFVGSYIEWLNL